MSPKEQAIMRAVFSFIALVLFVLFLITQTLQGQVGDLQKELQETQQRSEKDYKELEHKFEVYKNLCDAVISGRQEEW